MYPKFRTLTYVLFEKINVLGHYKTITLNINSFMSKINSVPSIDN